ncbi:MAG: alkaline phosphatase family protein [Bacteroidetes bacterium]|nr:MAG: alkaline phosphatase family protein [Bacteroidota bacterium]
MKVTLFNRCSIATGFCWLLLFGVGHINTSFAQTAVAKIAFGSCGHQNRSLSIFNTIVSHQPDLFVFLGDNVYADTDNMDTLAAIYQRLGSKPSYQNLKKNVPIVATWDDHDYGQNDAGRHFPKKAQSKQVFLDFFEEPAQSSRRKHQGIYHAYTYTANGKTLQVILLDVRTFRDNLKSYNGSHKNDKAFFYRMQYSPHTNSDSTLLGEEQWEWLEEELRKPADVRIIGSGSQFGITYNGYEAWANFPHEQQRLLNLLKSTRAGGVLFISGDVHYGEISRLTTEGQYPIYDVTSSGLSSTWEFATPNQNRIAGPVMENHFGLITINWEAADPTITMQIWDKSNTLRAEQRIMLSEISW